MTVQEFYAFTDTRPDNEKWQLIDGEPVLNASPSPTHHAVGVVVFARDTGFAERRFQSVDDSVELPALGISLPLSEIYRGAGLK